MSNGCLVSLKQSFEKLETNKANISQVFWVSSEYFRQIYIIYNVDILQNLSSNKKKDSSADIFFFKSQWIINFCNMLLYSIGIGVTIYKKIELRGHVRSFW